MFSCQIRRPPSSQASWCDSPRFAHSEQLHRSSQEGSAFLVTLLVLTVLTLAGLSLVATTSSEVNLSSAERTVQRSFYSADAGLAAATAQILHHQSTEPLSLTDPDTAGGGLHLGSLKLADEVEVTRSVPIHDQPCDLCQMNVGESNLYSINYAVNSSSTRVASATSQPDEVPIARSTVGAMVHVQPWLRVPSTLPTSDAELISVRH